MQIDALQTTSCRGEISVYFYTTKNCRLEVANPFLEGVNFAFWRVPMYILEAKIVLGVLYRKGVIPKKGGTLDFRECALCACMQLNEPLHVHCLEPAPLGGSMRFLFLGLDNRHRCCALGNAGTMRAL